MSLTHVSVFAVAVSAAACGGPPSSAPIKNSPLRVLSGLAEPSTRETTLRGQGCGPEEKFSVFVDDPDTSDVVRALWFIDPTERYLGGVPGNFGVPLTEGSTVREVQAPLTFMQHVAGLVDGRKHRVEVMVTDGEFLEETFVDATLERQAFLKVTRPSVTLSDGSAQPMEASRDEYVWFVEVTPCP